MALDLKTAWKEGGDGETEGRGGEILRFTRGMSFLCLRSDWIQARRVECVLSISIFFMLVILRGGWLLRERMEGIN